jgi:hypothetical protein
MDFSFFTTDNKSGYKTTEKWLSKNYPELYSSIKEYKPDIEMSFKERVWFFYNNLTERPKCVTCSKEIKFRERFDKPYGEFCSLVCINMNKEEMSKRQKKTFNKKYNVDFYPQHEEFLIKQRKTKKEKYGDENYNNVERSKKTRKGKYGDENYNNLNKQQNTIKEKYGETNISKTTYYKRKMLDNYKSKHKSLNILGTDGYNVNILCDKCGQTSELTKQLIYEREMVGSEVCIICNPLNQNCVSRYETELADYLSILGVESIPSYRKLEGNKEIDVFIPSKNIGIEIDGVYWHNELHKSNYYHLNKTELCKRLGIELIHIFEDEWLYKKDIVKSILQNKLGLINNKLYSRKCEIREVSSMDSKKFLDDNHIQGNVNSKVKLGLYYGDELVSLMTFSKGRIIMGGKKDEWELTRFCNKINYIVIGAASKLFKYFIKTYNPEKIISYSDIRLFDGKMYKNLGFDKISQSKPNYWYVINDIRHHRFNFRKGILVKQGFDENKTEKEIMLERKIYRIYDCGNIRWENSL